MQAANGVPAVSSDAAVCQPAAIPNSMSLEPVIRCAAIRSSHLQEPFSLPAAAHKLLPSLLPAEPFMARATNAHETQDS